MNALDLLPIETGSFYILDRGYLDFTRLHDITSKAAVFITRSKLNTRYRRIYSRPVDRNTGLRYDQTVMLVHFYARRNYSDKLRLVKFVDPETNSLFVFLTNNFTIPAITVADLYRCRRQV